MRCVLLLGCLVHGSGAILATPLSTPLSTARLAAMHRCPPALLAEKLPEGTEDEASRPAEDLQEDFDAGIDYGKRIVSRFATPVIDDPGLPISDALVVICATLGLASLCLSAPPGVPRPGWLAPLAGAPGWRGLPYILPAFAHGAGLALCWLPGALAAEAFEQGAYRGTWGEALRRTWRGGAFAIGLLVLATQLTTYVSFSAAGLEPVYGSSDIGDMRLARITDEVILDSVVQGVALTAFRVFRWADARR